MKRFINFIMGALVGSLIGATLAILVAPESGKELRNQIKERANAFSHEIQQAVNTKRIELQNRLDSLRTPKE